MCTSTAARSIDRRGSSVLNLSVLLPSSLSLWIISVVICYLVTVPTRAQDSDHLNMSSTADLYKLDPSGPCALNAACWDYKVPELYDYSKSTEENYACGDCEFVGKYTNIRSQLDYTYHKHYTKERQEFQDKLIDMFSKTIIRDGEYECETPLQNWLVFTAGCMGAGKGHTLSWLSTAELFPLESFVIVDPDKLRDLLPEFKGYVKEDISTAGYRTQKEVGYISEILTLHGLDSKKNVLVDGSLRDADWYAKYIQSLRSRFLKLKIGIIHVTAPLETIIDRCSKRSRVTGRVVPIEVIADALKSIPDSIQVLSPYVNCLTTFENDDAHEEPKLVRFWYDTEEDEASAEALRESDKPRLQRSLTEVYQRRRFSSKRSEPLEALRSRSFSSKQKTVDDISLRLGCSRPLGGLVRSTSKDDLHILMEGAYTEDGARGNAEQGFAADHMMNMQHASSERNSTSPRSRASTLGGSVSPLMKGRERGASNGLGLGLNASHDQHTSTCDAFDPFGRAAGEPSAGKSGQLPHAPKSQPTKHDNEINGKGTIDNAVGASRASAPPPPNSKSILQNKKFGSTGTSHTKESDGDHPRRDSFSLLERPLSVANDMIGRLFVHEQHAVSALDCESDGLHGDEHGHSPAHGGKSMLSDLFGRMSLCNPHDAYFDVDRRQRSSSGDDDVGHSKGSDFRKDNMNSIDSGNGVGGVGGAGRGSKSSPRKSVTFDMPGHMHMRDADAHMEGSPASALASAPLWESQSQSAHVDSVVRMGVRRSVSEPYASRRSTCSGGAEDDSFFPKQAYTTHVDLSNSPDWKEKFREMYEMKCGLTPFF